MEEGRKHENTHESKCQDTRYKLSRFRNTVPNTMAVASVGRQMRKAQKLAQEEKMKASIRRDHPEHTQGEGLEPCMHTETSATH